MIFPGIRSKLSKNIIVKIFFVVLFLASLVYFGSIVIHDSKTVEAVAFPDAFATWHYRKSFTVTNNVAQSLTGYQVKLTIDTSSLISAGKMLSSCNDMRFSESDGSTGIPYSIESGCNSTSTVVWLKTNLGASSTKTAFMYYGNSGASAGSDGSSVFDFYDGFDSGSSKWSAVTIVNESGTTEAQLKNNQPANSLALPAYNDIIVESMMKYNGFSFANGPRLNHVIGPIQTFIEAQTNGVVQGAWRGLWLGTTSNTQLAKAAPTNTWSLGTWYLSKLTTTSSLQQWEMNGQTLSATYARGATVSGASLSYSTWDVNYSDVRLDWVRIRKYASAEATYSSFSSEEYHPVMSYFVITGTGSQTAGGSQTMTVTAYGDDNGVYGSYSGDKTIYVYGANNSSYGYVPTCANKDGTDIQFGSGTVLTFTNGVATCNMKLYKSETAYINATNGIYNASAHTLGVTVSPQTTIFTIAPSSSSINAGTPITVTMTAKDVYGNPGAGFSGDHAGIYFYGARIIAAVTARRHRIRTVRI